MACTEDALLLQCLDVAGHTVRRTKAKAVHDLPVGGLVSPGLHAFQYERQDCFLLLSHDASLQDNLAIMSSSSLVSSAVSASASNTTLGSGFDFFFGAAGFDADALPFRLTPNCSITLRNSELLTRLRSVWS